MKSDAPYFFKVDQGSQGALIFPQDLCDHSPDLKQTRIKADRGRVRRSWATLICDCQMKKLC